jgi:hypothetical protein
MSKAEETRSNQPEILHQEANRTGDGDSYNTTHGLSQYPSPTHSTLPRTLLAPTPPHPTRTHNTTAAKSNLAPFPSTPSSWPRPFFSPHPQARAGERPVPHNHHHRPPGLDDYCAQHRDDRLLAAPLLPQRRPAPGRQQGRAQPRRRQRERRHHRAQLRRRAALPLGAVPRHPGT